MGRPNAQSVGHKGSLYLAWRLTSRVTLNLTALVLNGLVYNVGFEGLYILQDVVLKVIFEIKHTHKRNPGIPPIPPPPPSSPVLINAERERGRGEQTQSNILGEDHFDCSRNHHPTTHIYSRMRGAEMGLVLQGANVQALLLSLCVGQEADGDRNSPSQVQLLAGLPAQARMEAAFGPSAGWAARSPRGSSLQGRRPGNPPALQRSHPPTATSWARGRNLPG